MSDIRTLSRHPFFLVFGISLLALASAGWWSGWADLWASPDQRGRWLFDRGRYDEAAETFVDPMWRGTALMKAGRLKEASLVFGGLETPDAAYDLGNALVMLGRYDDAVARYDWALRARSGWGDAVANREIARLRAARAHFEGADATGQRSRADALVYDKNKPDQGAPDTADRPVPMSEEQIRSLWLKRVQTRAADFLRARFANQLQTRTP